MSFSSPHRRPRSATIAVTAGFRTEAGPAAFSSKGGATVRRIPCVPLVGLVLLGLGVALAVLVAGHGGARPAAAQTPTPHPGATYGLQLDCGNHDVISTIATFTLDGTPVGPSHNTSTLQCKAGQVAGIHLSVASNWNDLEFKYKCPPANAENTLYIPPPTVELHKAYTLDCPSGGITHTPTAGDPPGDATLTIWNVVGGVAELPPLAGAAADEAAAPAGGSGWPAGAYAALAGGLAAAAIAGGGWYARRRFTQS